MPRSRGRRRAAVISIVSAIGMLIAACGTEQPAAGAPPLRAERIRVPTEEELTSYLEWLRDWRHIVNRNRAEMDVAAESIFARHPTGDVAAIASDPEWLAVQQQLKDRMEAHVDRRSAGLVLNALAATVRGVGRMVARPHGMDYVPGRDEAVLSAARARYGDEFVDWVLARERLIVETLRQ